VDLGEVACRRAVEQSDDFATGQFLGIEGRPEEAGCGRPVRCGVEGDVDQEGFWTLDDKPDEGAVLLHSSDGSPALRGRGLESFGRGCDVSVASAGEEVEVLGGGR
jgi:hypothetical protein